jgi:putative membrane protein
MKKLLFHVISASTGLWLASLFIPGVFIQPHSDSNFFGFPLTAAWQLFILFGVILGLLNYFVKPILDTITLPLRIITLGLFSFVIGAGLLFAVDILFEELTIPLLFPLLLTTLTIWAINIVVSILINRKSRNGQ